MNDFTLLRPDLDLEQVCHTEWVKGDILYYKSVRPEWDRETQNLVRVPYLDGPYQFDCWYEDDHYKQRNVGTLRASVVPLKYKGEERISLRMKDGPRWFEENIIKRAAEQAPYDKGDLVKVRLGKGKTTIGLWLGLDKDWLMPNDARPTYLIRLCNKNVGEALGTNNGMEHTADYYGCPSNNFTDTTLRVRAGKSGTYFKDRLWWDKNTKIVTAYFTNALNNHYKVSLRKV